MANGSHDEKIARADRIAEQSAKAQRAAEQHRKATQNAIANLRRTRLASYSDEDEHSEVTIGKEGIKAKGLPPWALLGLALIALAALAVYLKLR